MDHFQILSERPKVFIFEHFGTNGLKDDDRSSGPLPLRMTTFGWFCLRGLTCTSGCIWGCSWWSRGFLATDRNRPKNDPLFESDSSKSWRVNQIIEWTILWLTGQQINKNYVNASPLKGFLDIFLGYWDQNLFKSTLRSLSITVRNLFVQR